jgi:four helix bundle protein
MDFDFLEEDGKPYKIKHRAYFFAKTVIELIKESRYDSRFSSLFEQLVRSSTSIGANLIEARAGQSRKDWLKFNNIALKSANESKFWICMIRDTMDMDKVVLNELLKEVDEISKIIASIIINASREQK